MNSENLVIRTRGQKQKEALQNLLANPTLQSAQLQQTLVGAQVSTPQQTDNRNESKSDTSNGDQDDSNGNNPRNSPSLLVGNSSPSPPPVGNGADTNSQQNSFQSAEQQLAEMRIQQLHLMEVLTKLGEGFANLQLAQLNSSKKHKERDDDTDTDFIPRSRDVKVLIQPFGGKAGENLDTWLNHIEFVKAARHLKDPDVVLTAVTALKNEPADWYFAMKLEDEAKPKEERQLLKWDFFKAAIIESFGEPEPYDFYLGKLVSLKQVDKIQTYNNEFACLVSKFPEMCDAEKRAHYIRGLRFHTQKEVKCKAPTTWQEAKQLATLIESTSNSIKPSTGKAASSSRPPQSEYKKSFRTSRRDANDYTGKAATTSKPHAIAPKVEGKKKPVKKKNQFQWTGDGEPICNKCHEPGHIQADCDEVTAEKQLK